MDKLNPFMNYRFNVYFTHETSGKTLTVPGCFAADGNAGQTSATSGNKWRIHLAPNEIGTWNYKVDFRKGNWRKMVRSAKWRQPSNRIVVSVKAGKIQELNGSPSKPDKDWVVLLQKIIEPGTSEPLTSNYERFP